MTAGLWDSRELWQRLGTRAAEIFQAPPQRSVSECADRYRIISGNSGAVEPGPWRTARTPYLREIMDTLGDPTRRRVVVMKSSQVGGTEVAHNWLLDIIVQHPAPVMWLCPTDKALQLWSANKLGPLIEDTPALRERIVDTGGRRDARNTMSVKTYPGGALNVLAGRSSAQLRALSGPYAVADEIDELEADLAGQGDPLTLLERAQRNFLETGAMLLLVSTPTDEETSRISREFEASDQRYYHLPCSLCGEMQRLEWRDEQGRYRLVCDRDANGELIPASAQYLCAACGGLIDESAKPAMLTAGEWRAMQPERRTAGFHLNTLLSPFVRWAQIVEEFQRARKSDSQLKAFDNLWLGLPSKRSAQQIDQHFLAARAESYGDQVDVPNGVGIVTAGVDVQVDRLECVIWGFGAAEEKWAIRWERLDGDPARDEVWEELDALIQTPVRHASGAPVRIAACAIDAGYQIDRAWRFADARRQRRVFAYVGRAGRGRILLQAPDPRKWKRTRRQSKPVHVVGVDSGKDVLTQHLQVKDPGPQYVHFPDTLDPVFFEQLTAERLVTSYVHGFPQRVWELPQGRRNEVLDCTIGAMAALQYLGPRAIASIPQLAAEYTRARPEVAATGSPGGRPAYGMISGGIDSWP